MNPRSTRVSDKEIVNLMNAACRGDSSAFAAVVRATQGLAFSLAFRFLSDEEDAKDVVQEAFVNVWKHLADFDPSKKFTTWLYAIVSNLSVDSLRSRKRRRTLLAAGSENRTDPIDPADIESIHANAELAAIIRRLTGDLPPTQKLVFTLRDLQDCSIAEVAEVTGLSVGSVKTNLHLARKRMKELLTPYEHMKEHPA